MRRFLSWKWLGRVVAVGGVLAAVAAGGLFLFTRWQSEQIVARLDRDDPGWRLDDVVRETNAKLPPADRNPFVLATAANDLLPADYSARFNDFPDWSKSDPNTLLDAAARAKLLAAYEGMEPAAEAARGLADLPDAGGNVVVMPPNPLDRIMEKEQHLRLTTALLRADAYLLAEEGKPDAAVRSVRAGLGTARALGDDPTLIGQLIRIALGAVAGRSAERVINNSEPDRGLAELQAELLREADAPKLVVGLRGERASADHIADQFIGPRPFGSIDRACSLDLLTRYIDAAKLPSEQQAAALGAIVPPPAGDPRYVLTSLLLPAVEKCCNACLRGQGELRAVAVGVACERHRRRFGTWPAQLADIPPDLLAAVPADPGDGQPIKYQRRAGLVVVYSVGPDGVDHGGLVADTAPQNARDYGVRLYDPDQRRKPAPAEPPPPPGDAP